MSLGLCAAYLSLMEVNERWLGWMDGQMPVAARRLEPLACFETGQDMARRLGGRGKEWRTQGMHTHPRTCTFTVHPTDTAPTREKLQVSARQERIHILVRTDHITGMTQIRTSFLRLNVHNYYDDHHHTVAIVM
jgi:hypothetical protein